MCFYHPRASPTAVMMGPQNALSNGHPNSARDMQWYTQDGLDEWEFGPWEDPRRDQRLTLLRLCPAVEGAGQVASQARRAACQEMAQPGPGLGFIVS